MKTIIKYYQITIYQLKKLKSIPLLIMRLILAYGFWTTGMMKWRYIDIVSDWFESLGIPFPTFNAYLTATTEITGTILLIVGLGTRIFSIPLSLVLLVAIFTVHFYNGFEASNNGFEIPLYYLVMLFTLFIYGPGKISLDYLFFRKTLARLL